MGRGKFWGKEAPIVKYSDTLLSPVQKQLNCIAMHAVSIVDSDWPKES